MQNRSGEVQLAVERRGTLNTGGRNHKLDCIFLVVFHKSEVLKNAVFERWCSDSNHISDNIPSQITYTSPNETLNTTK